MNKEELITHLIEHDNESNAAGGLKIGELYYHSWTEDELIDAHEGDHKEGVAVEDDGRFFYTHTHEGICNG